MSDTGTQRPRWGNGITLTNETTAEDITHYIKFKTNEYTEYNFKDRNLWESYQEDFDNFEVQTFKDADRLALKGLKQLLRRNGVWVFNESKLAPQALYDVAHEDDRTEWSDAEIKLYIDNEGPFNSYAINRRLKLRPLATTPRTPQPPIAPTPQQAAPPTQAPPAQAPPTQASSAQAPSTQAPSAQAPSAQAPSTQAPPAQALSAQAPPTQAPSAQAPSAQAPPIDVTVPPTDVTAPPTNVTAPSANVTVPSTNVTAPSINIPVTPQPPVALIPQQQYNFQQPAQQWQYDPRQPGRQQHTLLQFIRQQQPDPGGGTTLYNAWLSALLPTLPYSLRRLLYLPKPPHLRF